MSDTSDPLLSPPKQKLGEAVKGAEAPIVDMDQQVRVLICDDNAYMRDHLKTMLEADGLVVAGEAVDGLEAVAMFDELRPDVVIMDLVMPNLDGIGAINQIIAIDEDARIVVCSGMGSNEQVAEAIGAGALDFLVKPFQVERVAHVIRTVLPGVVSLQGRAGGID